MRDTLSRVIAAAGLFLLIAGTALYPAASAQETTPTVLFGAGALLLLVSALANIRALAAFFKKRQARFGANAILVTLLLTAVMVIIQAISIRNTYRYDFTRNKRYTLSDQTQSLLARLDGEVELRAFVRKNTSAWRRGEALLRMYRYHGPNVRYELIDPDVKPHVVERYRAKPGEVVVDYNDNRRTAEDLSEEAITNALLFASRDRRKTVCFVTGHDEKRLDGSEAAGLLDARRGLENTGFLTRELSLVETDSVPPDCAVLVVAGPKKEYLQAEAERIGRYLERGGNVLFLLDPPWPISRLKPILERFYVMAYDYVLLDEISLSEGDQVRFDATYTKIHIYNNAHPITRDFRSLTIFPVARPLVILPHEGDLDVSAQSLAVTGQSVWGETDVNSFRAGTATRDRTDLEPPLAVAVVSERRDSNIGPPGSAPDRGRHSKIVVIGDSDFATNRFYRLLGNADLFLNSVEYLAEDEVVISIRPKKGLDDRVYISAGEGRLIFLLCLVLLPLTVASLGAYVILRKRKA